MIETSGLYWRILFADRAGEALAPVRHKEGRFHHSGQEAIYLSPSIEAAHVAIDSYYREDDPPRVVIPLRLSDAYLLDFRDPDVMVRHGLAGHETRVNWRDERAAGQPASSWSASDAAREAGADGMLYTSRKRPEFHHLVLFRWNSAGYARLTPEGKVQQFIPQHEQDTGDR